MNELDEIIPYIRKKEWLLFIGAGLSKIAGCYDWNSVLDDMLDHEVMRGRVDKDQIKENQKFSNDELLDFCEKEFIKVGKENVYWGILRKIIHKNPEKYYKQYFPLLKKIKEIDPFTTIITTNIDDCLEESDLLDSERIFYELDDFKVQNLNPHGIFHIHGYKERFKESILTRSSYIQRYRNTRFQDFLTSIFEKYTFLFIGYSLRDTDLKNIIHQIAQKRKHFILVPEEDNYNTSEITVYLDQYGVKIINYGQIREFPEVLNDWISGKFGIPGILKEEFSND